MLTMRSGCVCAALLGRKETAGAQLADMAAWIARSDAVVLVAVRADGLGLEAFAEVGERPFADGCDTSPVAYLEGWYVDEEVRRQGIGTALVRAAEAWARARGYREFASDALLDNADSQRAHEATGFVEVERAVRFKKDLYKLVKYVAVNRGASVVQCVRRIAGEDGPSRTDRSSNGACRRSWD